MARRAGQRHQPYSQHEDGAEILEHGEVISTRLIPWSSNYSFLVSLAHNGTNDFLAIYKPRKGERPLWDFPSGTLYKRELAAYLASQALGWDFIPATVIRDGPHGVGSMQRFVPHNPELHYHQFRGPHRHELARIALFDYLSNNADRKDIHCIKGDDGKIWGIDHGLTFNHMPKLRTVIWEFAGKPVPDDLMEELLDFWTDNARMQALGRQLAKLIEPTEIKAFHKRIETMLHRCTFPDYHERNVPWPFF